MSPAVSSSPISRTAAALTQAQAFLAGVHRAVARLVKPAGEVRPQLLDEHQYAVHGLAWCATYVRALEQLQAWAARLEAAGRLGAMEAAILEAGFSEYLAQLDGGIALSQGEIVRPADLGLSETETRQLRAGAAGELIAGGRQIALRARIAALAAESLGSGDFGEHDLDDETADMLRDQLRRFVDKVVAPQAHRWHRQDALIPRAVIDQMAELGVFGVTIAEADGGLGLGKLAMCVVTEELSRGYIGVGSLGTRAEIAGELIAGGAAEQKAQWLPAIAAGRCLATAVFTEPDVGSDLGALKTSATLEGDVYRITGNKTWITHAGRADLMVVLARTDPASRDWRGLSMFLAPKTPATDEAAFPDPGLEGGEIEVLGYRGMKEYELRFDRFAVPASGLLGEVPGQGFKQLMKTFESARIQTAARAIGVAQNAFELGLRYALERRQFGKPIVAFPRISGKLGWMVVETMIARQLTYYAARQKDLGLRCDIEAGMAKLLAARVAWSNADNALQIHGGNGYALEYPISRVLCDARILNIFEGAAEIQAQVVGRGLLERDAG